MLGTDRKRDDDDGDVGGRLIVIDLGIAKRFSLEDVRIQEEEEGKESHCLSS